jgi:hypothetical protein
MQAVSTPQTEPASNLRNGPLEIVLSHGAQLSDVRRVLTEHLVAQLAEVVTEVTGLVGGVDHGGGDIVMMPAGEGGLGQKRHRPPATSAETGGRIGEPVVAAGCDQHLQDGLACLVVRATSTAPPYTPFREDVDQ